MELRFLPAEAGERVARAAIRSDTLGTPGYETSIDVSGQGLVPIPIQFEDVTVAAGLVTIHAGSLRSGQGWGDIDGDGWLDLFVTDSNGPDKLFMNQHDGTFAAAEQTFPATKSAGVVLGDYDNDGWIDLFVCSRIGANTLYRNVAGTLVDVTTEAGLGGDNAAAATAAFGDYDGDGDLDLYVGNYDTARPDELYRNEGDGTFSVASGSLDTTPLALALAVSFLDYDNDGDLDIYVVNDRRGVTSPRPWFLRNLLYRNDGPSAGGWAFSEVAEAAGADIGIDGMGLAVGDYDLNGTLDLFMSDIDQAVFLHNRGDGTFVDATTATGTGIPTFGWGTVFADFDLDGWPDLYLTATGQPNRVFRNLGDGSFANVSATSGADDPGRTLGVAYADYDRDGDVDLVIGNQAEGYRLLRNLADPSAGWVGVRLEGGGPVNRSAIGTRVSLTLDDGRVLMQEVKSGSSFGSGNDLGLRFGLGEALPASMSIRWPNGTTETIVSVPVGVELQRTYP